MARLQTQRQRALALLDRRGMARLSEFLAAGITAATISRLQANGAVTRLNRGLYQRADAPIEAHHSLAQAAKIAPNGVVCLVSAAAFHELTDHVPARLWMAIGAKARKPRTTAPALQFVRFAATELGAGVAKHRIEGVTVRITEPAKTVVDLFRYRRRAGRRYRNSPGLTLALESLRTALKTGKARPAEIARHAERAGVWRALRPYLEALTAHG